LVNHIFSHNFFDKPACLGRNSLQEKVLIQSKTTSLTGLAIIEGVANTAHEVYTVTMTVGGTVESIKAGEYKGKILITVTKG
jgi:hypothetical protein